LIQTQIIFFGGALAVGLVVGALSHSAVLAACAAGMVAILVAVSFRTGD
jgi:hypothetical protein